MYLTAMRLPPSESGSDPNYVESNQSEADNAYHYCAYLVCASTNPTQWKGARAVVRRTSRLVNPTDSTGQADHHTDPALVRRPYCVV